MFVELCEESIVVLRGSEKNFVDMLFKVFEEYIRAMKCVLGEVEVMCGIMDVGYKMWIDWLDEWFERFEVCVVVSEFCVEFCEVSMKFER